MNSATGLRREGIYFGIMNFGEKIAAGGALLLAGGLLAVFRKLSHGAAFGDAGTIRRPPSLTWACYTARYRRRCWLWL